jgi:hypothetical protein
VVVRDFELSEIKTKAFAEVLGRFEIKNALVVISEADECWRKAPATSPASRCCGPRA